MKSIKTLSAAVLVLLSMAAKASAQTDSNDAVTYPQFFIGVQGGGQTTLTDYNNWKLVTPTASFSIGSFFTPIVGARLHLNGMWNKGGYCDGTEDFKYKYKYLTTDLDMLFNLVTLFGRKNYYPMNVYLIGGFGFNYAWDNSEAFARTDVLPMAYEKHRFSHNARIGLMFDYNVSKHVSINLEADANTLSDHYNSKRAENTDWYINGLVGVKVHLGKVTRKVAKTNPCGEIVVEKVVEKPVEKVVSKTGESLETNVFFAQGKSVITNAQMPNVERVATFLKNHKDATVEIRGYASPEGSKEINERLAKARAEAVKSMLVKKYKVNANRIDAQGLGVGDMFSEPEWNRVSVCTILSQNK